VTSIDWQPPTLLIDDDAPPAFPISVFPPWLRDVCSTVAAATQTPVDLAAFVALGGLATAVQRKIEVEVRRGWTEPLSLFLLSVLNSGEGKSPVFAMLIKPIVEAEYALFQSFDAETISMTIDCEQLQHQGTALKEQARKASDTQEEQRLLGEAKAKLIEANNMSPVPPQQLLTTDATPERLASLMFENSERIAILSDESAALEVMCGRYSPARTPPNLDVYLKGWSGGIVKPERKSSVYGPVRGAALTVCITAQPSILNDLGKRQSLRDRGLLARFLYCVPQSIVGHRLADPPMLDEEKMRVYSRHLDALLKLPVPREESDEDVPLRKRAINPHLLKLAPYAYRALVSYKAAIEPSLGSGGAYEDYRDWMNKAPSQAIRIAALLHIAWQRGNGNYHPWNTPISAERMQEGIQIVRYAQAHMVRAYGLAEDMPRHITLAQKCIRMLQRLGWDAINSRQIQQHAHLKKEDADAVIGILEDHGYIRAYIPEKTHRNNRQRHFLLNPYILRDAAEPSPPERQHEAGGQDGSSAAQEATSTVSQSDADTLYDEDFEIEEDGYSNLAALLSEESAPEDQDLIWRILRSVESDAYDDARDFARLYGGNGLLRILEQWIEEHRAYT
jgi:hypothetical protein